MKIFRNRPKKNNKKFENNFKNEFYIASNEFSKQKLISFYGIEDCAITTGLGSCMKLENIFGASTISRGSNNTLANSNESLDDVDKDIMLSKKGFKNYKSNNSQMNIAIDDTISELKKKLKERNTKILGSNNTITIDNEKSYSETNLENNLTSSDTIYRQSLEIDNYYSEKERRGSSSTSIDYFSSNPDVVIDINTLKKESNLSSYLSKSNSNSQINNHNIHDEENKDEVPKKEITIDINNATNYVEVDDEANNNKIKDEEKEKNVRFINNLYAKKFEELNKNFITDLKISSNSSSTSNSRNSISYSSSFRSEESFGNLKNQYGQKTSVSYDYLNSINKPASYHSKLYNNINNKNSTINKAFLNKLGDRYSPQQRLFVSFNQLYDPLFVSNNLSKRYDVELKFVDLNVKDIYEHGLPYLLRSKRPLIEFCKELIKECQIEVLFFINDVCDYQKKLFTKQSDIFNAGKEIYNKYLSDKAVCPLEVSQSLKLQCVKDLRSLKKECFHAISLFFYKNLDFIYEEFKRFVLKEHYNNRTEFDNVLITQKTEAEKKAFEDELIKLVEIYYKSNDELLIKKQEFIIENIKELCKKLLY
ncbi:hypothetical protein BCR32DRAFT_288912 [Anaeromyces robustus]|uniref:Uncharacterized protein n=1 Tax=Anaeromyces robustus TaxID=1754192 RepID=A0A1Y1XQG0_9FUNG|nr:hypothetical protein BCR32DRAFT_288912 [Anaeromyces robustus]|eukprot:ORX87973.1 hypothetical protein BCR32DRAFT_288912 [Anaeromyces robustus]